MALNNKNITGCAYIQNYITVFYFVIFIFVIIIIIFNNNNNNQSLGIILDERKTELSSRSPDVIVGWGRKKSDIKLY